MEIEESSKSPEDFNGEGPSEGTDCSCYFEGPKEDVIGERSLLKEKQKCLVFTKLNK